MSNILRLYRTARKLTRGGFTLVELLVVIGIIAILAGVALGPITRGIKQAQENATVQVAHQIGVLEFAYSNDYNQVYPNATNSEGMASLLLNNGYASNPSLFYVANTPGAVKGSGTAPYTLVAANCNWDFVTGGTNGGLTSATNDGTPLCQLTGANTVTFTTTGPIDLTLNTAKTAFGGDGIAVYYKGNNAKFLKAVITGAGAADISSTGPNPWIDGAYNDSAAGSYKLIIP